MWISQKVNNDPEVKKTLQEITKLIKSYSDATYIKKEKKFFTIDIGRLFKPRLSKYFSILFSVAVIEALLFYLYDLELSVLNNWIRLSLTISLPILVLGISLSTVAKSLSESSRFASEYLKDSCRITIFACLTFLTVFYGYLSCILFPTIESSVVCKIMYILLSPVCVGGAIWCLTSLIYIILETTKCMYPEFSIEAASNYASRKLSDATLKKVYLSVWMGKYKDILSEELKKLKNIHQYWSKGLLQKNEEQYRKSFEYQINLPKEINFHFGFRDYNLREFEKLNNLLESKDAKLYLNRHGFDPKRFGTISCKEPCEEIYNTVDKNVSSICRFREDQYVEKEKAFWEEHYLKLHSSLLRAIEEANMAQFRRYLTSIEETYVILRKIRKYTLVRKYFDFDFNNTRYLFIYSKSVKWLLENKQIEEDIRESFLDALVESIWQQVEDEIRNGDWCTLDIFKWLLPKTYQLFVELVEDKKSRLWGLRARIGGFYDYAGNILSQYESEIKEEDKLQIQLVLHKGIISWLLIAIDNEDDELIKSLCMAARRLVFQDKKIIFNPQKLVTQHFILCGKMLEFLMGKKPNVSSETFMMLCFDRYNRTERHNIDYDKVVKFFIESRKDTALREYLHEFSSTDWKRNPLSGVGTGTPSFTFSPNIGLDYMFIYLALLSIPLQADLQTIPFDFSSYNLKDKIDQFKEIANGIEIYDYPGSKKGLNGWLDGCEKLYKQREEERIANAPLNEEKVSQYKDDFWEGYKSAKTFLSFCINQGYYSINNEVSEKGQYVHTKELFIDGHLSPQSIAGRDGSDISRYRDKDLLKKIISSDVEHEIEITGNITSQFNTACQWLTTEGANRENGILLFYGKSHIPIEFYNNDYFIPSWKEDRGLVFSGNYKNYPIITIYDADIEPKCVALNLQGWKGLEIRTVVLEKNIFGKINIREWPEEKIDEAIRQGKFGKQDRNCVKGQCPIEYELFWRLDENVLPRQMIFSLKVEASTDDANR